jgi:hypothetical protein
MRKGRPDDGVFIQQIVLGNAVLIPESIVYRHKKQHLLILTEL